MPIDYPFKLAEYSWPVDIKGKILSHVFLTKLILLPGPRKIGKNPFLYFIYYLYTVRTQKVYTFLASGEGLLLYTDTVFTGLHNDSVAQQDPCGKCRIRTRDHCLSNLARYNEPPHLRVNYIPVYNTFI